MHTYQDGELLTAQNLNDSFKELDALTPRFITQGAPVGYGSGDNSRLMIQGGEGVFRTDGRSRFTVTYPSVFPNGVLAVMAITKDVTACEFIGLDSISTNSATCVAFYKGNGKGAGLIRANWVAIGW